MTLWKTITRWWASAAVLLCLVWARSAGAQVSPQEVVNPDLKALTSEYFQKLIALNRQISTSKFPFQFHLARYIGLNPKDQQAGDTRGLEFVRFHERTILKFSGNYNAAFSSKQYTRNQRAGQVYMDVAAPILRLLPQYFPEAKDFEGIGFEISYHVLETEGHADFEGRENLVVVLSTGDALRLSQLQNPEAQQEVINVSEVYVSGQRYGLALGKVDPFPMEQADDSSASSESLKKPPKSASSLIARGGTMEFHASPAASPAPKEEAILNHVPAVASVTPTPATLFTAADVDGLQEKYQSALGEFGKQAGVVMSQSSTTSPDLALFRNALYLQLTVRNPEVFDKDKTSLYKRAALSFDTFLAPHLGDLLAKAPAIPKVSGLNITVLVRVSASASASEAVEFICPLAALRSFAAYEITNQDLIDQSVVVVNGVRISLNLQRIE